MDATARGLACSVPPSGTAHRLLDQNGESPAQGGDPSSVAPRHQSVNSLAAALSASDSARA